MVSNRITESVFDSSYHLFDANVIYELDKVGKISALTVYVKSLNKKLVTTELVKNEIEKNDREYNRNKMKILINELGNDFFVHIAEEDVKGFFNTINALSILKSPYSWGICNFWNINLDPSYFLEVRGVYYPKEMIEQSTENCLSPADITLMAYLIKLYNECGQEQLIYTDDTEIDVIGNKSGMYLTIRYIQMLSLLLKNMNLSFSMFIRAVNSFIGNHTLSLPLKNSSPACTTKTIEEIEKNIVAFTDALRQKVEGAREIEKKDKASIVNTLKGFRDSFKYEFKQELNRYSDKNYKKEQVERGNQSLRNLISEYEKNIRELMSPYANLIIEANL